MPVDLLFDARHIRQSGIGTYIATLLPHLETLWPSADSRSPFSPTMHTVPPVRDSTVVVFARPSGAPMYSVAEQRAWSSGTAHYSASGVLGAALSFSARAVEKAQPADPAIRHRA